MIAYTTYTSDQFTVRQNRTVAEFLADLHRLAQLVGELLPECWIICRFVSGLLQHVSFSEHHPEWIPWHWNSYWPGFAPLWRSGPCSKRLYEQKTRSACALLLLQQSRTYSSGLLGKWGQGWDGAALLSRQTMNEMLPVIWVHANETLCTALVDWLPLDHCKCGTLPCLEEEEHQSDHYKWWNVQVSWNRNSKCCTDTGNSADVEVLVVLERQLDFDLQLGYDAIKAFGGVLITQMGIVIFCEGGPCVCSAQDWPTCL